MSQSKDIKKLKSMITDLTHMKKDLLNEPNLSQPADTFEAIFQEVNQLILVIKCDSDRLMEIKKSLSKLKNKQDRDQTTIQLQSQISSNSRQASEMILSLSKIAEKDEKKLIKKGKSVKKEDEKKQEDHLEIIQVLKKSLKLVNDLIAPESDELITFRRSRQTKQIERDQVIRNRRKSASRRERRDLNIEMVEEEEPTENVKAWMSVVDDNMKQQDEMLAKISDGLDDLKRLAEDMNSEFNKQDYMIKELDGKMDDNIENFRTANRQLKTLLEKSGGCSRWGTILVLCIVLLALIGAIFLL